MPIYLGVIIVGLVLVVVIMTRKTRKEYHDQPVEHDITVSFKKKPDGIKDNDRLNQAGYWYKDSDVTYRVKSKLKKDDLTSLIMNELNLERTDFDIRETTDLFVSQGRLG